MAYTKNTVKFCQNNQYRKGIIASQDHNLRRSLTFQVPGMVSFGLFLLSAINAGSALLVLTKLLKNKNKSIPYPHTCLLPFAPTANIYV